MKNEYQKFNKLDDKRIIITGVGYKPLEKTFYHGITGEPLHDPIFIDSKECKLNIGTAVALALAVEGATVHMVSRTDEKLKNIKKHICEVAECDESKVEYSACDITDKEAVEKFIKSLSKDKIIYWVQSIGLGAGAYKIKDDNPYLHIEDIPSELLEKETNVVLKGTHILMQKLLPIFRKQNEKFKTETRIAIISSMSAIRGYSRGGTHCAAKGAISRYTNSAMLDLWKERIYITDVRPGAIDTGAYDNKAVQEAILEIDKEYGGYWSENKIISLAPPISVGHAINTIFTVSAHITSLNLVASGQMPHEGS